MLCRHNESGRNVYLCTMRNQGLQPYAVDIFDLRMSPCISRRRPTLKFHLLAWLKWLELQIDQEYYSSDVFAEFEKHIRLDLLGGHCNIGQKLWVSCAAPQQGKTSCNIHAIFGLIFYVYVYVYVYVFMYF